MKVKGISRKIGLTTVLTIPIALFASPEHSYRVTRQFAFGGDADRSHVISVDTTSRRLFVAHDRKIEVLNEQSGEHIGSIGDAPGISGIAIAPELKVGFVSNRFVGSLVVFDITTLAPVRRVQVSEPNFVLYDSFSKRVFPLGRKTTVLDAATGRIVGALELDGDPESAVSDGEGAIFINLSDEGAIAVIDVVALKAIKVVPVPQCVATHGLAYDSANQVLFVGCNEGSMAVVNAVTGNVIGRSPTCSGIGSIAFDKQDRALLISCSEGVISVVRRLSPYVYYLAETVKSEIGARTMVFDPLLKRVFLPVETFEYLLGTDQELKRAIKPRSSRVLPY
jgi:hypothetical protein